MKRNEPVSDLPFPEKFDIHHWESNEKFEKSLQQHKISHIVVDGQHHRYHKHPLHHHYENHSHQNHTSNIIAENRQPNVMGAKRTNGTRNGFVVSDCNYDTPL